MSWMCLGDHDGLSLTGDWWNRMAGVWCARGARRERDAEVGVGSGTPDETPFLLFFSFSFFSCLIITIAEF